MEAFAPNKNFKFVFSLPSSKNEEQKQHFEIKFCCERWGTNLFNSQICKNKFTEQLNRTNNAQKKDFWYNDYSLGACEQHSYAFYLLTSYLQILFSQRNKTRTVIAEDNAKIVQLTLILQILDLRRRVGKNNWHILGRGVAAIQRKIM